MQRKLSERSQRKREAILESATELFLSHGYGGASMEAVAAAAAVSKQTVYKHFQDKEALFREIVMATVTELSEPFQAQIRAVEQADDVPHALRQLARTHITSVITPDALRRRRLVVREADRLPDLARAYYDAAVVSTLRQLAASFERLIQRGELTADDPEVAATHFAFLVLGRPLDAAMFGLAANEWSAGALTRAADAAVSAFLAAYRPQPGAGASTGKPR